MRILLDARCILGRKTGDRTYWLGLLRALPHVAPEIEFVAALDGPAPDGLVPPAPNLKLVCEPRPAGRLWSLVALPRLAARLRTDLVHLQYTAPPWLPCPFVTTVHDCSFELHGETFPARDRRLLRATVPWTCRRAGAVVGVSETTRLDLLRLYGLPVDRVFAAPNGIGAEYRPAPTEIVAEVRRRYDLPAVYLLSVGVLQPRKNLAVLLEALALVVRERGECPVLAVVGKRGWEVERTEERVAELGLGECVRFLGYVPDDDLPALYTGACLFCYPSRYEGFGLPPLEAAACGTLPLVSDAPALVEVTGDDLPHLPVDDAAVWAAAMARLLGDAPERNRLAALAADRAGRYTWELSAHDHLRAYRRAMLG